MALCFICRYFNVFPIDQKMFYSARAEKAKEKNIFDLMTINQLLNPDCTKNGKYTAFLTQSHVGNV